MSPLLIWAVADVAASDPRAATKAPATSAVSVRLDISVPPIGVDFATCAVAVWRAVRRAFPKIRPDDRKGYAPRVRYMTAIGLISLKYQWIGSILAVQALRRNRRRCAAD